MKGLSPPPTHPPKALARPPEASFQSPKANDKQRNVLSSHSSHKLSTNQITAKNKL